MDPRCTPTKKSKIVLPGRPRMSLPVRSCLFAGEKARQFFTPRALDGPECRAAVAALRERRSARALESHRFSRQFCGVNEHTQLELFTDRAPTQGSSNVPPVPRSAGSLSDAALIAALPDSVLSDACALAAEAARRRLGDAVTALVALCNRFVGYGVDCKVPEQAAALEALACIGGPDASRSVGHLIAKGIVQGPTLAVAATAASTLGVTPHRRRRGALRGR